jgi:hypothetical protein
MPNLTTAQAAEAPPRQTEPPTPAGPLDAAEARVRSAHARVADESTDRLDWLERDTICRDLAEALSLIREAKEGEPRVS